MDEGTVAGAVGEARRVIGRPRLVRLLDESEARIVLLVAPAGYGKTTLARQWLAHSGKRGALYRATPASRDVAALALGLRRAITKVAEPQADRLSERLRTTSDPDGEAQELAELLAHDIGGWPSDAHLLIDDYQHIAENRAAERLTSAFLSTTKIPALITSRVRPSWISARDLLYGEALELERSVLAMTPDEAEAVLARGSDGRHSSGLVAHAEGWPAVIGLAALLPDDVQPEGVVVPEALHSYFAEELYHDIPRALQWSLAQLSLAPILSLPLARVLFGDMGAQVLDHGYARGFLTKDASGYELHPLLRQFLRRKLNEFSNADVKAAAETIGSWYLENEQWDESFALAGEFQLTNLLLCLIEEGLDSILSSGRLATLDQWLHLVRHLSPGHTATRICEVETAFRRGRWRTAESKAIRLGNELPKDHPLAARAFFRAGQIAQLDDRPQEALELLNCAKDRAQTPVDVRRTLWSRFITLSELEEPDLTRETLREFERIPPESIEDVVRASQGGLYWAIRWGGIALELERQETTLELLSQVSDPLVRTGFLQTYGIALALHAKYEATLEVGERQIREIEVSGLEWVRPHALELQAIAKIGLREFEGALKNLQSAHTLGTEQRNLHTQMNAVVLMARLLLARGAVDQAIQTLETDWDRAATPGMEGDYLATRALALACAGRTGEAEHFIQASEAVTTQIDGRVLRAFAQAVITDAREDPRSPDVLELALSDARSTGNFDAFVCAYRAAPSLLVLLGSLKSAAATELRGIARTTDPALAAKAGLARPRDPLRPAEGTLTSRELTVLGLLRQGLTNREIAKTLWISESTAKVHVRHILGKLGVRSRTEAAMLSASKED